MALRDTTIRDWGGGWNVADSDVNLESRYQPISDNVRRGIDGSLSVRSGYGLFCNLRMGTSTVESTVSITISTVINEAYIQFAYDIGTAKHITITAVSGGAIDGIPNVDMIGTFGVLKISAAAFRIPIIHSATSSASAARDITFSTDTHMLAGNIIHMHYFNRFLVVFDDIGEIARVNNDGVAGKIWDYTFANTLTAGLIPTRASNLISSTTFKTTLISCNGYDKDKPLQIFSDFTVKYLIDKAAGGSGQFVPKADYVIGMHNYLIFLRTEPIVTSVGPPVVTIPGDTWVKFSAKGTDGTFLGAAGVHDATDVDLSMITETVEPLILGCGPIRDKLFVGFYDRGIIGTIGIYDDSTPPVHKPDFEDTIAEHGLIAHRTVVPLGNDIFMCDYAGVPSVSISQQSGIFVPSRLSDLIDPAISSHLSSLSQETLRTKAFALFNKTEREYMLFLPKYDETTRSLPTDPFYFNNELIAQNLVYVNHTNHNLLDNSYILVTGAIAIGTLTADKINGKRKIMAIVDRNAYILQLDGAPLANSVTNGGGALVQIVPFNDETIGYIYEYNRSLKIRRWTRYRDMNFACGAVSQRGIIFFAKGGRIYQFGTHDNVISADHVGDYDEGHQAWAFNTLYVVGTRVKDTATKLVYKCLIEHTSPNSGTFASYRATNFDTWKEYLGEPINWAAETPWSDFKQRGQEKHLVYVNFDTEGLAQFDVSVFTNSIRVDNSTYLLKPARTMQMTSSNAGGFGIHTAPSWGSGRRTREDRVWPFDVRGKLLRFRYSGSTITPFRMIAHTMYFFIGSVRR